MKPTPAEAFFVIFVLFLLLFGLISSFFRSACNCKRKKREREERMRREETEAAEQEADDRLRATLPPAARKMRHCPWCGKDTRVREFEGAKLRVACPDSECGWVNWGNPVPVVAAIVPMVGKIRGCLFVRRKYEPGK